MKTKEKVKDNILDFFEAKLREIQNEIYNNKYDLRKLVAKQTLLKRTRAELCKVKNEYKNNIINTQKQ